MSTVQIELPEPLAQQARQAGLFSSQKMEAMLCAEMRRETMESLWARHARLPAEELTPEIEQEIVQAVRQVRVERRQNGAG